MSSAPSRSSTDVVGRALTAATSRILQAVEAIEAPNPVILIDGRSGAGKSSLALRTAAEWPGAGRVQLVALDSLYPGWDGLELGVDRARVDILRPHARGTIGTWNRWDWHEEREAEAHAVDPALPLIIEGAGILMPGTALLADVRVWCESPSASRRRRALERDGDSYRPHWDRWAKQEQAHIERNDPAALATVRVEIP
ncbi:hypothetical protein [Microbacterium sp. NPDC055357]